MRDMKRIDTSRYVVSSASTIVSRMYLDSTSRSHFCKTQLPGMYLSRLVRHGVQFGYQSEMWTFAYRLQSDDISQIELYLVIFSDLNILSMHNHVSLLDSLYLLASLAVAFIGSTDHWRIVKLRKY